jgi:hypothetical protein
MSVFDDIRSKLPGSSGAHVRTPRKLANLDGLWSSTVDKYLDHGIVHQLEYGISRTVSSDASGSMQSHSEVRADHLRIWVPTSKSDPVMLGNLNKANAFKKMEVVCLSNVNGENQVQRMITFENLQAVNYRPFQTIQDDTGQTLSDVSLWEFRYTKITDQVIEYDQTGKKLGQNVTTWDYGKAAAS